MHLATLMFLCECLVVSYTQASFVVCDRFDSYSNPDDQHCFENHDDELNNVQIVKSWGFTVEEFNVFTEDKYQINILRVYDKITKKNPLVFGHGVVTNAITWICRRNRSIAHHYGKMGFDIWMVNFRGTEYSRGHVTLTTNDDEYWNFSFHEMAVYDLKSTMELVNRVTKQKAIYIGFSMGTTVSYVYATELREHAGNRLMGIISLAPVAYLDNIKSYLKYLAPFYPLAKPLIYWSTHGEIFPRSNLARIFCTQYPWQIRMCNFIRSLVFGVDEQQIDPMLIKTIYIKILDSISIGNAAHYSQIIQSRKFQQRDFGRHNPKVYGQRKPPRYNLSNIEVPIFLHVAKNDWIATESNAWHLYHDLQPSSRCGFSFFDYQQYDHNDILEAIDINITYVPLTKSIKRIMNGKCSEK